MPDTPITGDGLFYRRIEFERGDVNADERTVDFSFSSEFPVQRNFGAEILDHSDSSVDLSRMNSGGPLLMEHDPKDQIGVCKRAYIANGKCRGVFKFGNSKRAKEILADIVDGIRTAASVGYRINKLQAQMSPDGMESYRAISWTPHEVSVVACGEDPTVGPTRTLDHSTYNIEVIRPRKETMSEEKKETPVIQVDPKDTIKKERLRCQEIEALTERCIKHNPELEKSLRAMAIKARDEDFSVEQFRTAAFEATFDAKKVEQLDPNIGMSKRDLKDYSIARAIRNFAASISTKRSFDGLEREASDATAKLIGRDPGGFFLPNDVLMEPRNHGARALMSTSFTAAGAFIDTNILVGSFIELLRNRMVVASMGATSLSGLVGNVAIPSQTGGATAYWLPDGGTVTVGAQAVGQLSLTPHQLSCATAYSKQLLNQSSVDVENFVRTDLMKILAIEKDRAALNGAGAGGEPLGIINTTGLSTNTTLASSGTTITYANALTTEGSVATSNADLGALGWVTTILCRQNTRGVSRFANTDTPVWSYNNDILGYPAKATNQMPSTTSMIFGNWNDLILADWAGVDVVVDPYSLSKQAQIQIVINIWTDNGIRHAKSFVKSLT